MNQIDKKSEIYFLDPTESERLIRSISRHKLKFYSKKTNTYTTKSIKFDFNSGIAYCNGHIVFRVLAGTPVLVKNLIGSKKETDYVRKILNNLKIKPKEINCKYGLCRINEEINDLIFEKNKLKLDKTTLKKRSLINNQISFLRHIGSLCSIQDKKTLNL